MTKANMIKTYRQFSAADNYILGFVYEKMLYMVRVAEIMPRYLNVEEASRNQGENLRLRLKKAHKAQLMKKAPICLGSADCLNDSKYNKGEVFEKLVTEYYGQTWTKNSVPFTKSGDIIINGISYQIKYEDGTFTNERQLAGLEN